MLVANRNSAALSVRDYVQFHHVRVNTLPTRVRTSRCRRVVGGPPIECRAGCSTIETAAHVIQGCHSTHGGRILRHDAICRIAVSSLRQLGWSVRQEPHFHTREGLRKPDIVAVKDQVVKVIDAQVISASSSLDDSHRRKVAKYDTPDIRHQVASEYGVENDNISFSSITISWRGIWSAASAAKMDLKSLL
uniref:Reverse transcriptase n=1 Tax=Trichogramma kaykai TaxID=54128 RepID=A0ABD2W6C2_9HYME